MVVVKHIFFDVNLNTGATRYFNTNKVGRVMVLVKALSGNKLYIGVNDPCYIWEYDISTGGFAKNQFLAGLMVFVGQFLVIK